MAFLNTDGTLVKILEVIKGEEIYLVSAFRAKLPPSIVVAKQVRI